LQYTKFEDVFTTFVNDEYQTLFTCIYHDMKCLIY